jgi:hypothetical protein
MLKKYTINILLNGNENLKLALRKLRHLRVRSRHIDYLSHMDSAEKSVRLVKAHKGYQCAFMGLMGGALLGLVIWFLNQLETGWPIYMAEPKNFFMHIWLHVATASVIGSFAGFFMGQKLVQYVLRYDEVSGMPRIQHLLMVNVNEAQKEPVMKALEAYSESIDLLDNGVEIEMGLRPSSVSG